MLDATAPPRGDCEGRCIGDSDRRPRRVGHQVTEHCSLRQQSIRLRSKIRKKGGLHGTHVIGAGPRTQTQDQTEDSDSFPSCVSDLGVRGESREVRLDCSACQSVADCTLFVECFLQAGSKQSVAESESDRFQPEHGTSVFGCLGTSALRQRGSRNRIHRENFVNHWVTLSP